MKQKGKVAIYVEEKETYKNAPFRIKMGKGYYLQGENEIERKEWENANPVPEFITSNDENPNGKHIR